MTDLINEPYTNVEKMADRIAVIESRIDRIEDMVTEIHSAITSMASTLESTLPALGNSAIGRMLGIGR